MTPTTAPVASTTPHADSAVARAAPVNRIWMTLMICGTITAAAAPCTHRARISSPLSGARPQASDAAVNTVTPSRYIRRRPYRSPSRAPVISSIA